MLMATIIVFLSHNVDGYYDSILSHNVESRAHALCCLLFFAAASQRVAGRLFVDQRNQRDDTMVD